MSFEQVPGRRQNRAQGISESIKRQRAAWELGSASERISAPDALNNEYDIAPETGNSLRSTTMVDISKSIKTGAPVSLKSLLILESIKEEVAAKKIALQMKMQEDPSFESGFAAGERRLIGLHNLIGYIENYNEKIKQEKAA